MKRSVSAARRKRQVAGDSQGQIVQRGCAAATALWPGLFPSSTCLLFAELAHVLHRIHTWSLLPSHPAGALRQRRQEGAHMQLQRLPNTSTARTTVQRRQTRLPR